jgi:transposase
MDALSWMARTGARWGDLQERFGDYRTVKRRYYNWLHRGVPSEIFKALSVELDVKWVSVPTA